MLVRSIITPHTSCLVCSSFLVIPFVFWTWCLWPLGFILFLLCRAFEHVLPGSLSDLLYLFSFLRIFTCIDFLAFTSFSKFYLSVMFDFLCTLFPLHFPHIAFRHHNYLSSPFTYDLFPLMPFAVYLPVFMAQFVLHSSYVTVTINICSHPSFSIHFPFGPLFIMPLSSSIIPLFFIHRIFSSAFCSHCLEPHFIFFIINFRFHLAP